MLHKYTAKNSTDAEGMPAGGEVRGEGLIIDWQDGPLQRHERDARYARHAMPWEATLPKEGDPNPNGAFVETVIAAVKQRIEWYQTVSGGKFACAENADAIDCLARALKRLDDRTQRRTTAGVEGTYGVQEGHDGPGAAQ